MYVNVGMEVKINIFSLGVICLVGWFIVCFFDILFVIFVFV